MSPAEAGPSGNHFADPDMSVVSPRKDGANGKACATTETAEAAFLANVVQMPSREKKQHAQLTRNETSQKVVIFDSLLLFCEHLVSSTANVAIPTSNFQPREKWQPAKS
jgi:hypothetical protein